MLDHVVEHGLGREQQPPVERHRAVRRAGRPARALTADRQAVVGGAGAGDRGVEPRGDLRARGAPVPALERLRRGRAPARAACRRAGARACARPGRTSVSSPSRYGTVPGVRATSAAARASARRRRSIHGASSRTASSAARSGRPLGQRDLHRAVALHADPHASCARRSPKGVFRHHCHDDRHGGLDRHAAPCGARALRGLHQRRPPGAGHRLRGPRPHAHLRPPARQGGPARLLALVPRRLGDRDLPQERPGRRHVAGRRPSARGPRAGHRAASGSCNRVSPSDLRLARPRDLRRRLSAEICGNGRVDVRVEDPSAASPVATAHSRKQIPAGRDRA